MLDQPQRKKRGPDIIRPRYLLPGKSPPLPSPAPPSEPACRPHPCRRLQGPPVGSAWPAHCKVRGGNRICHVV